MKKAKRYAAGEDVEGDYASSDDAKNLEAAATREKNEYLAGETAKTGPLKMASFGDAFKEARKAGDKTFEYMGKKYTTEMAGEKKASAEPKTAFQKRAAKQDVARAAIAATRAARRNAPLGQMSDVIGAKKGGAVKKMAKGGSVGSASKRADGCAQRGKTRGRMV